MNQDHDLKTYREASLGVSLIFLALIAFILLLAKAFLVAYSGGDSSDSHVEVALGQKVTLGNH